MSRLRLVLSLRFLAVPPSPTARTLPTTPTLLPGDARATLCPTVRPALPRQTCCVMVSAKGPRVRPPLPALQLLTLNEHSKCGGPLRMPHRTPSSSLYLPVPCEGLQEAQLPPGTLRSPPHPHLCLPHPQPWFLLPLSVHGYSAVPCTLPCAEVLPRRWSPSCLSPSSVHTQHCLPLPTRTHRPSLPWVP